MLVNALGNIWNIYLVSALQLFYFLSGCRFHVHANQRRVAGGGFSAKPLPPPQQQQHRRHQQQLGDNIKPNQRSQTLDSLFANMKEQRMKAVSRQNNVVENNGAGNRRPPWGRGRYGN